MRKVKIFNKTEETREKEETKDTLEIIQHIKADIDWDKVRTFDDLKKVVEVIYKTTPMTKFTEEIYLMGQLKPFEKETKRARKDIISKIEKQIELVDKHRGELFENICYRNTRMSGHAREEMSMLEGRMQGLMYAKNLLEEEI